MMMKAICMVKGITLQNPEPKLSAMDSGGAPMQNAPRDTTATASMAKAKASGNQRSDQAQQHWAARDRIDLSTVASNGRVALIFHLRQEGPSIPSESLERHLMPNAQVL